MYQLLGLGSARSEQVSAELPAMGICMASKKSVRAEDPGEGSEKFDPPWRKSENYVSPKLCVMEDVDILIENEHTSLKRAAKRDTISVQMISRICKCFMTGNSLAGTEPRRREIKSTISPSDSEDYCKSLREKRAEVEKVNLFYQHGGREENMKLDQRRAGEERERIQQQRKKLIDPHPHVPKPKRSKAGEGGRLLAKHLKNVRNIFRHQQTPVSGSRSRCSDCCHEHDERKRTPRSNFSTLTSSPSNVNVALELGQTKYNDSPKKIGNGGSKVEKEVIPATRTSEDPMVILTEKKRNLFSTSQSNAGRTNKDLMATASISKEPPPATSQLQRSTSVKDYFEAESKTDIEAKQREEDPDVFQQIEGESPCHRKQRYQGFKRLQSCKRAALKIQAIHQQDEALQREQDEKIKAAHELDPRIQRWSYRKEGNLRALLSTLQNVLWPECKWKMVPTSELMTPTSVKKVYRRASFCLHPDKVQQKGGTLEQKYVAEKVFGVLRDAWNKFYTEEFV